MKGFGLAGVTLGLAHAAPSVTALAKARRLPPRLAGRSRAGQVALTFDNGSDPASTPYFLDLLDELSVRGNFFLLGRQVAAHPALAFAALCAVALDWGVIRLSHSPLLHHNPASDADWL